MNGLPYYKRYPKDFLNGTVGMSLEAKGAYSILLDIIYMHGGELVDDPRYISGLLGCSVRKWNAIAKELLSLRKVEIISGLYRNYRASLELESSRKYQSTQAEKRRGYRKNKDLEETTVKPSRGLYKPEPDADQTTASPMFGNENENPEPAPPRKKGTRISEDWALDREGFDYAAEKGLNPKQIEIEAEKFHNYWISRSGSGATKLDWKATWRNWILNCNASRPGFNGSQKNSNGLPDKFERQATAVAEVVAEMEAKIEEGQ